MFSESNQPHFAVEGYLPKESSGKIKRITFPVSPICNIQCRYCTNVFARSSVMTDSEISVITPIQALSLLSKTMEDEPLIAEIGVSGPGEPLATDDALDFLELVNLKYPKFTKYLGTNGLLLADKAERIAALGVKEVTVTVNAVDFEILKRIIPQIFYNGRSISGGYGARLLLAMQWEGIRKISSFGVRVTVSTVVIPGLNENQIEAIAKFSSKMGASALKLIPLSPQGGFKKCPPPSLHQLDLARKTAERHITVIRAQQGNQKIVGCVHQD